VGGYRFSASFYPINPSDQTDLDQMDYGELILIGIKSVLCISTFPAARPTDRNFDGIFEVAPVPALSTQGVDGASQIKAISSPHFTLVVVLVLLISSPFLGIGICDHPGIATLVCFRDPNLHRV
jgi:hypothetical protein